MKETIVSRVIGLIPTLKKGAGVDVATLQSLSEKEFLEQILEICHRDGDFHNPVDGQGWCYYKKTNNNVFLYEATSADNCLIGKWLLNAGFTEDELPVGMLGAWSLFNNLGLEQLADIADQVQTIADRDTSVNARPPLWKNVAVKIKNMFEPELSRV